VCILAVSERFGGDLDLCNDLDRDESGGICLMEWMDWVRRQHADRGIAGDNWLVAFLARAQEPRYIIVKGRPIPRCEIPFVRLIHEARDDGNATFNAVLTPVRATLTPF
jgi:hypothetical protein